MEQATFIEHHPDVDTYLDIYEKTMALVTLENVQTLFSEKIIKFKEYQKTEGVINVIFHILTESNENFLLRVANPHPFWRTFSVQNHVQLINQVKKSTSVPVPELVSSGIFLGENNHFFEYILFKPCANAITLTQYLEEINENQDLEAIKVIVSQGLDVIKQLQSIPVPQKIGALSSTGEQVGVINDGPRIGPCSTYKQYILEIIDWSLKECEYINKKIIEEKQINIKDIDEQKLYEEEGYIKSIFFNFYATIRDNIINDKFPYLKELNNQQFFLCHNDLCSSNILFDKTTKKISAVIDWDSANITIPLNDPQYVFGWISSNLQKGELLDWYQSQCQKMGIIQCNSQISNLNDLIMLIKWACFWVNNWWRGKGKEEVKKMIIKERLSNLQQIEEKIDSFQSTND